jgi:hypothetical protein
VCGVNNAPSCTNHSQCNAIIAGATCNLEIKKCVAPTLKDCNADEDCTTGESCKNVGVDKKKCFTSEQYAQYITQNSQQSQTSTTKPSTGPSPGPSVGPSTGPSTCTQNSDCSNGELCNPAMKICLKRDQASAGPSTGQQEGNQQNQNQDQVPNDTPKDQDEAPSCNKDAECNMLMEGATCNQETKKCQSPTGPPPCAEQLKMDPKRADHFCEMAYKQYAICDKTTKKCKDGAKPDLTITEKTSTQKNTERKQAEDAITKRKGEEKDQMDEFF